MAGAFWSRSAIASSRRITMRSSTRRKGVKESQGKGWLPANLIKAEGEEDKVEKAARPVPSRSRIPRWISSRTGPDWPG